MKSIIKLKTIAFASILNFAILWNAPFLICNIVADTTQSSSTTTTSTESESKADSTTKTESATKTESSSAESSSDSTDNSADSAKKTNTNEKTTKNNPTPKTDKNNVDTDDKTVKVAQNNSTEQKNKITVIESIDSGWTSIVPHEDENKDVKNSDMGIRVADKKISDPKKQSTENNTNNTNNNNFGIWDALPENVTKDKPKPQPKTTSPNSTSPFTAPQNTFANPTPKTTTEHKTETTTTPKTLPQEAEDDLHEPPQINVKIQVEDEKDKKTDETIEDEIKEPIKASLPELIIDPNNKNDNESKETTNTAKTKVIDENKKEEDAANKTNVEVEPSTTIPNHTADEITKRLNDLEKEKTTLEQMLKNKTEKPAQDAPKTNESDFFDDVGVSRSTRPTNDAKSNNIPNENIGTIPDLTTIFDSTPSDTQPENAIKNNEPKTNEAEINEPKTNVTENPSEEGVVSEPVVSDSDSEGIEEEGAEANVEVVVIPDFDDADAEEPIKNLIDPSRVGDSNGVPKIKLMYDEVINGLKSRNITGKYERWKEYARTTLRNSSGINTGSELDGRSRLKWYEKLYNDPIYSVFEAEEFTRKLHDGLRGNHRLIGESMAIIRDKLDIPARSDSGITFPKCETPLDAISEVKRALISAQMHHARAVSTLTAAEQTELVDNLVQIFVGKNCVNGHTIPSRTVGRRLLDMLTKMDKAAMHDAAEAFIPLLNGSLLELLDNLPENALPTTLIGGQTFQRLVTSVGDIVIGGRGSNVYDLDSPDFRDVICVIDLGGDDTYRDGTSGLHRPVLLVIDLHGNDVYTATRPGVQGGSVMGVSVLIDVEGDDHYSAVDIAQGSSIGGVGMLFDFAGNDSYKGLRRVQAHALSGIGMIIDREGNDSYHAAMWAQGFGAPAGFGVLEDTFGDDHYYCGGLYIDSYPEHPGYDGWGQGIGAGIRQVANGGIGALLEGDGNDVYEVDYFGHGGGYWLGVGFARDFGGNDVRHGTTLTAYNGTARRENKWTRFANGFGCHYSVGYCFDDEGNDVYGGTIMGTGMAWDLSMGYLCDFDGSNKFTATGGMTQGVGAEGSIGILFSYGGDDTFSGRNQAYANGNISYHSVANCGSNFSFVINYGGTDTYGSGAKNNSYVQRGSTGGFLIDRPTDSEAVVVLEQLQAAIELRNNEIKAYDEKVETMRKEAAAKGRRYYPRTRRPAPIAPDQQRIITGVPEFKKTTSTKVTSTNNNTTIE
ncbi:MAG: hypothetical protein LBH59_05535 [Planctomycetaceae bacterium]|jgi:hypothetical protein|nr:hypothetical protein [Planctomycetaceae bacterium]